MLAIYTLPRLGFRRGWLYYLRKDELFRFRATPRFRAEYRTRLGAWVHLDLLCYGHIGSEIFSGDESWKPPHRYLQGRFIESENQQWLIGGEFLEEPRQAIFNQLHVDRFRATVSKEVHDTAVTMGCDYFSALEFFSEVPEALALAKENPLLAVGLARHWDFPSIWRKDWMKVSQVVKGGPQSILNWFKFPANRQLADALVRVTDYFNHCGRIADGGTVRTALKALTLENQGPALLKHDHIPFELLDFLKFSSNREWLDASRLELPDVERGPLVREFFSDISTLYCKKLIDKATALELSYEPFPSVRLHRFVDRIANAPLPKGPPSPLEGAKQLMTAHEFIEEGRELCHGLGSLGNIAKAVKRRSCFYRVDRPVRATVALWSGDRKHWEFYRLRGPNNIELPPAAEQEIKKAFSSFKKI